jgi:hypothetical protein
LYEKEKRKRKIELEKIGRKTKMERYKTHHANVIVVCGTGSHITISSMSPLIACSPSKKKKKYM